MITTSTSLHASSTEFDRVPPLAVNRSLASTFRSNPATACPALSRILCHRQAHIAEPDEADPCHDALHPGCFSGKYAGAHAGCSRAAISASHLWVPTRSSCNHVRKDRQIRVSRWLTRKRSPVKTEHKRTKSPGVEQKVPEKLPDCSLAVPPKKAEQRPLYIYDAQTLIGFIDRHRNRWRAVAHGREIGRYQSRKVALAALHESIDESG